MSTVFKRYDCEGGRHHCYGCYHMAENADGDWVSSQDAYDHIAILEAKIRTLETQLKDLKREKK